MRIEKLNEKQLRCTLTSDDLTIRHLNISELAYGTEKARSLFREMLTQASREFNFHAENIPLMIEAVPMSGDCIVLLITKVEDPEELDTRFSRFSSAIEDDEFGTASDEFIDDYEELGADEVLEEFERLCMELQNALDAAGETEQEPGEQVDFYHVFAFSTLDEVCLASKAVQDIYDADNSLYKDEAASRYYLAVHKGAHSPQTFNKVCNMMAEYGRTVHSNAATEAFYQEHCKVLIREHALQSLRKL